MELSADVEMDDSHLPKSSSSAMPDLQAATVPRLKAKVHRLTPDRLKQISLSDLSRIQKFCGVVVSLLGCFVVVCLFVCLFFSEVLSFGCVRRRRK